MSRPALPLLMQSQEALRTLINEKLNAFNVQSASNDQHHAAAVAVVITEEGYGADLPDFPQHAAWSNQAALLLTRRSAHLRKHAGQWALPGGRIDAGETPEQAALRELAEEVHLELGADAVLGRLDDFVTRSGFIITPVVIWAGAAQQIRPNPAEVASTIGPGRSGSSRCPSPSSVWRATLGCATSLPS